MTNRYITIRLRNTHYCRLLVTLGWRACISSASIPGHYLKIVVFRCWTRPEVSSLGAEQRISDSGDDNDPRYTFHIKRSTYACVCIQLFRQRLSHKIRPQDTPQCRLIVIAYRYWIKVHGVSARRKGSMSTRVCAVFCFYHTEINQDTLSPSTHITFRHCRVRL